MEKLAPAARLFISISMIAFGIQHLYYRGFVTRVAPDLPAWVPVHAVLAYIFGTFLILAGLAITFGIGARAVALVLGGVILLAFLLLHVPALIGGIKNGGTWTMSFKGLMLAGGSFLVAGSLKEPPRKLPGSLMRVLEACIPLAPYFLGAFLLLCGILHFIYAEFVATLVPSWIPGHMFWTYFAGVALIAGGVGIMMPATAQLASWLTALMVFSWVFLIHIPRALAEPLSASNEKTAVFEAIAVTGTAALAAIAARTDNRWAHSTRRAFAARP